MFYRRMGKERPRSTAWRWQPPPMGEREQPALRKGQDRRPCWTLTGTGNWDWSFGDPTCCPLDLKRSMSVQATPSRIPSRPGGEVPRRQGAGDSWAPPTLGLSSHLARCLEASSEAGAVLAPGMSSLLLPQSPYFAHRSTTSATSLLSAETFTWTE